ncbi:MAG TPA: sigma-70 family RNA polymerase sigma factor [Ktedonobacteraceae bacterium]|nr:sigma-70 family RNA polymerase sigma factor [Ktedonobacteraceae bacterium]
MSIQHGNQDTGETVDPNSASMLSVTAEQSRVDRQNFQAFYHENLGPIYRYVYSKVGNREEAEDVTSQIFIKAVREVDFTRGSQRTQKWLFQVARTTIADYWRAHYRTSASSLDVLLEAGWEGPVDEKLVEISSRPMDHVQRILSVLPEHYREVLTCRFLLNLSIRDTASKMGLSEANVKVLQFRALKRAADLDQKVTGTSI